MPGARPWELLVPTQAFEKEVLIVFYDVHWRRDQISWIIHIMTAMRMKHYRKGSNTYLKASTITCLTVCPRMTDTMSFQGFQTSQLHKKAVSTPIQVGFYDSQLRFPGEHA